jgi:hypothetical protein
VRDLGACGPWCRCLVGINLDDLPAGAFCDLVKRPPLGLGRLLHASSPKWATSTPIINGSSRIRRMLRSARAAASTIFLGPLSADFGPHRAVADGRWLFPACDSSLFFNHSGVGSAMEISGRSGPSWNKYLGHPAARSGSSATVSRAAAIAREALALRTTIGARGCLSQAGVNGVGAAMISSTSSKAPNCDRELLAESAVLAEQRTVPHPL